MNVDPKYTPGSWHYQSNSPAIDAGSVLLACGSTQPGQGDAGTLDIGYHYQRVLGVFGVFHMTVSGDPAQFEFSWDTVPNRLYAIEYKNDLNEPEWKPLANTIGLGNTESFVQAPSAPTRFYRISVR
jgi:hypothetical protein